ncbi:MAG: GNAT family N-acetyltransferase [Pirellulales bacterium]|nr:GNAT family N-acetyltransferase [Pirellulales bacterium]
MRKGRLRRAAGAATLRKRRARKLRAKSHRGKSPGSGKVAARSFIKSPRRRLAAPPGPTLTLNDRNPTPEADPQERVPLEPLPHTVVEAAAGDHGVIYQFLQAVFQGPSSDHFAASNEDPFYEPRNRLVVKDRHRILAHIHATQREVHFGAFTLPAGGVAWLGTVPEVRGRGLAQSLLASATGQLLADGAQLGFLRTRIPHFFRPHGWACCGRHSYSRAGARAVMARLAPLEWDLTTVPYRVRPWRQVELPALMRLYGNDSAGAFGRFVRREAYWRWLLGSRAFDQVLVAVNGPDRCELADDPTSIVGYAITRQDRARPEQQVLELMVAAEHPDAAAHLLARACSDALERDPHISVVLHAAPDHPLHDTFAAVGGHRHWHEVDQGEVTMVRLLAPQAFLGRMVPLWHARAEAARLDRPCELGLLVEGERWQIILTRRSAKLVPGKLGRSYLSCNWAELTRLLLGHSGADEPLEAGRLESSTKLAADIARVLFPMLPLWHSPLDTVLMGSG